MGENNPNNKKQAYPPSNGSKKCYIGCNTGIDSWPQFVVMRGKSLSFKQMSPISFAKFLVQTIGEPETCKRLQNGNYLIKCTSQVQSDKFLSISQIGSIRVEALPHAKGVITSENLYCSFKQLLAPRSPHNFFCRLVNRVHTVDCLSCSFVYYLLKKKFLTCPPHEEGMIHSFINEHMRIAFL